MIELLPCSKCRRVPNGVLHATDMCGFSFECGCGLRSVGPYMSHAADTWNRYYGSPLTLAERPQDEPCVDADAAARAATRQAEREYRAAHGHDMEEDCPDGCPGLDDDEPSVGDGVREIVPTCDGRRWRDCGDALARWSVMACSGGG